MNKVVVITGGSNGLGKEIAKLYVENGDTVVINGRNKEKLEKVAEKINATPIAGDMSNEQDIKNLRSETVKKFGRIDIWINNAGIWMPYNWFEQQDSKEIKIMFEVNVYGTLFGSKYAVEQMKKQEKGYLVNICSSSALQGRPRSAHYCASKFAVKGFTKSLYLELKEFGINVSAIYPGGMKTNLFDKGKPSDYDEFMDPEKAAKKIFDFMQQNNPPEELIIKRGNAIR